MTPYPTELAMRTDIPPTTTSTRYPYFPPEPGAPRCDERPGKLAELHLYEGSMCNRACSFCCVAGSPQGWWRPFDDDTVSLALELVHPRGCVKFYGGEPTIHPEHALETARALRRGGFEGTLHLFSNGVLAERLTALLDELPGMIAVLNYSILHGRGAEPLPPHALRHLLSYPAGRIFSSHDELLDTPDTPETPATAPNKGASCPHCYPVLRSDGVLHGCPFAVESDSRHFILGRAGEASAAELVDRFWRHIAWQRAHVEPTAARLECAACTVCADHLDALPLPRGW